MGSSPRPTWYDVILECIANRFNGLKVYPVAVRWSMEEPNCLIIGPAWAIGSMRLGFAIRVSELNSYEPPAAYAVITNAIRHVFIDVLEDQWAMPAVELKQ